MVGNGHSSLEFVWQTFPLYTGVYMKKQAFSSEKIFELATWPIIERINQFDGKLYLEFGGRDQRTSRLVSPWIEPDNKDGLLQSARPGGDCHCHQHSNIEHSKPVGTRNFLWPKLLRLIDKFNELGIFVGSVVITQYAGQALQQCLSQTTWTRAGSPLTSTIRSRAIRPYGPTSSPWRDGEKNDPSKLAAIWSLWRLLDLVLVSSSVYVNMYHDQLWDPSGYAKFETFPVWNLPFCTTQCLAYGQHLQSRRCQPMIDPFHLQTYGGKQRSATYAISGNLPCLEAHVGTSGTSPYASPTDMSVR